MILSWSSAHLYDFIQRLSGTKQLASLFKAELDSLPKPGRVLDIGAGTGLYQTSLQNSWYYLGLDSDPTKLRRFTTNIRRTAPSRAMLFTYLSRNLALIYAY